MLHKPLKITRQILVLFIGIPITLLGLILIPLPGPGLLVTALGLLILAAEFEWAQKHKERAKRELRRFLNAPKSEDEKPSKNKISNRR